MELQPTKLTRYSKSSSNREVQKDKCLPQKKKKKKRKISNKKLNKVSKHLNKLKKKKKKKEMKLKERTNEALSY